MNKQQLFKLKLDVLDKVAAFHDHTYIVGGACRDILDGIDIKDIDICTPDPAAFIETLKRFCSRNILEYKVHPMRNAIIFSMEVPKRCYDRNDPHNDKWVDIEVSKYIDSEEITGGNRDFTCNAIHWSCGKELCDRDGHYTGFMYPAESTGAIFNWKDHILQPVYPNAFNDNPVRIFRAADMMCRHTEWTPSAITYIMARNTMKDLQGTLFNTSLSNACGQIVGKILYELTQGDREWEAVRNAFNFLMEVDAWSLIHPSITAMKEVIHKSSWHNDSVWQHTIDVMNGIERIFDEHPNEYINRTWDRVTDLYWAALLHDVGKVTTITYDNDGTTHFYGHQDDSVKIAEQVFASTSIPHINKDHILKLIKYHMVTKPFHDDRIKTSQMHILRRLIYELGSVPLVDDWVILNTADCWASTRSDKSYPAQKPTIEALEKLDKPYWVSYKPVLTGAEIEAELHCDKRLIRCYLEQLVDVAFHHPTMVETKEDAIHYIHTLGEEWKGAQLKKLNK